MTTSYWPRVCPDVIRDRSLKPLSVRVYLALSMYADAHTGECYPSQETLADDIGVGERCVRDHLNHLVEAGYVEKLNRRRRGTQVYSIATQDQNSGAGLSEPRPEPPCRSKTVKTGTAAHQDRHGDDIKTGTATPDTIDIPKKQTKEQEERPTECELTHSTLGQQPHVEFDSRFLKWYDHYPRKVKKQAAQKAYSTAITSISRVRRISRAESHAWLVDITATFAASSAGKAGRFCPYPTTWLNAGQYDDDPSEWQRTTDKERKRNERQLHPTGQGVMYDQDRPLSDDF